MAYIWVAFVICSISVEETSCKKVDRLSTSTTSLSNFDAKAYAPCFVISKALSDNVSQRDDLIVIIYIMQPMTIKTMTLAIIYPNKNRDFFFIILSS
jgi:hypothetical protein